jgi:outer membrane lipoprotein-sorting protein
MLRWNFFSLCIAATAFISTAQERNATEIVEQADQHLRGQTSISELIMKVVRPGWSREIRIKSWTKGRNLALILITAPARDRGTTFLLRDREVWNWIPSVEKIIKIPPSMMMQSWMGSDFTNDDLVKESSLVNDYTHTWVGDSTIEGRDCYKIELIPKPDAPVVWGKIFLWISKKDYLELRAEYYDEDGEHISVMEMSEIRELGGRLIPTRMVMTPVDKPDHQTILEYRSLEFDRPLEDTFFSQQNMKRLRP